MNINNTFQTIILRDGRRLAYSEFGDPQGKPIFEFHGNPSSRLGSVLLDDTAREMGIRVIGIDRPGIGLSDFQPNRKLLDWPNDVNQLADSLGLEKFPILGGSGGVPATLACAYKIPERLTAVGVLFGPRPFGGPGSLKGWSLSRRIQAFLERIGPYWMTRVGMKFVARMMRDKPEETVMKMFQHLPPADMAVMNRPWIRRQYINTIQEAFRAGPDGVTTDKILTMKPWGYKLQDIKIAVHLWHGNADSVVPPAMGRYLADTIPNCKATFLPDEGHFSLLPNHARELLNALLFGTPRDNEENSLMPINPSK